MRLRAWFTTILVATLVAACGGSDDEPAPDSANARQLFSDNCANCHTLAAAGATGKVGPDLDQVQPGPQLVMTQVARGGGAMPSFEGRLSDEQIEAIANYVSDNAGQR